MESVDGMYQPASQVGRVACLPATVDLTKPRVHLYERILQGRSRGVACYPLIEVNHGAKCGGGGGDGGGGRSGGGRGGGDDGDDDGRWRVGRIEGRETVCEKAREPIRGQIVAATSNQRALRRIIRPGLKS